MRDARACATAIGPRSDDGKTVAAVERECHLVTRLEVELKRFYAWKSQTNGV